VTPDAWAAIIALIGVVVSILASSFIIGIRWGKTEETLNSMNSRLTRIEALFTLKLKREVDKDDN
jgi:hypothetical protein